MQSALLFPVLWLGFAMTEPHTVAVIGEKLGDTVSLYSLASGHLEARIPVGVKPHEFALARDGKTLYVTLYGLDRYDEDKEGGRALAIVDLAQRKKIGEIPVGTYRRPHGIEWGPNSGHLFVTVDIPAAILEIDPTKRSILRAMELPDKLPHMMAIAHDESRIYTANSGSGSIGVLDLKSGKVTRSIPIGGVPMGLLLSPDGKTLYATNRTGNALAVIDTGSNTVRQMVAIPGEPVRLAIEPGGGRLFVTNIGSGDLAILDTVSLKIQHRFPIGPRAEGIHLDVEGRRLFLSAQSDNLVKVFSLDDYRLLQTIKTGAKPDPILLLPKLP